ncbi:MAG: diadenylate cyclase CdaA, partial [Spirochaetaceae bacterium]|nr:diadenylate cyclase CdaA [Spirochaetaceae bacterium]
IGFLLLSFLASWLGLQVIDRLLGKLGDSLLLILLIIFQPELRKLFLQLGQTRFTRFKAEEQDKTIEYVLDAAEFLSERRRGMLVVFTRRTGLKDVAVTGTEINALVSSSMLITIFGHDTPLHDGAVLIQNDKIIAAGCFLPLSEQYDIKKTFGTRHRAALGLSEQTDAVVLVVSEETGALSLAYDSKLYYDLSREQIIKTLTSKLESSSKKPVKKDGAYES